MWVLYLAMFLCICGTWRSASVLHAPPTPFRISHPQTPHSPSVGSRSKDTESWFQKDCLSSASAWTHKYIAMRRTASLRRLPEHTNILQCAGLPLFGLCLNTNILKCAGLPLFGVCLNTNILKCAGLPLFGVCLNTQIYWNVQDCLSSASAWTHKYIEMCRTASLRRLPEHTNILKCAGLPLFRLCLNIHTDIEMFAAM
jgi:hypothetical protein